MSSGLRLVLSTAIFLVSTGLVYMKRWALMTAVMKRTIASRFLGAHVVGGDERRVPPVGHDLPQPARTLKLGLAASAV